MVLIILLFIILFTIILASIFHSDFQKFIFGSSEATFKSLTFKGAVFAVICLGIVYFMVDVYNKKIISETQPLPPPQKLTLDKVANYLKETTVDNYELSSNGAIELNDIIIGRISSSPERPLDIEKSNEKGKWYVEKDSLKMGFLSLDPEVSEFALLVDTTEIPFPTYMVGRNNLIGQDFYFKIDSIQVINPNEAWNYAVSFGEKSNGDGPIWLKQSVNVQKTNNGRIKEAGKMELFQQDWKSNYYVQIGLGHPLVDEETLQPNRVQMVNIKVRKTSL